MYRNAYQRGMLTVFFSVGSKPLAIWDVHVQDGYVTRFLDQDIKSMVLEIGGTNVSTSYITCPKGNMVLGITMPFLVMIVKNLKKYFTFEVTILDETSTRRRFRVSNFQSSTQILPLCTVMPIALSDGWNQIQFNLAEFTRRAYKKQFVEVQKLKINANIRLRRIYFTERLIPEDQLPAEYKLYFPLASKGSKDKKSVTHNVPDKDTIRPSTSQNEIKAAEAVNLEEKAKSMTKVVKSGSKADVNSIKRMPSVDSRKSKTALKTISDKEVVINEQTPDKTEEVSQETKATDVEKSSAEEHKETANADDAGNTGTEGVSELQTQSQEVIQVSKTVSVESQQTEKVKRESIKAEEGQ